MAYVKVTVTYAPDGRKDLALPLEVPVGLLANALAEALHLAPPHEHYVLSIQGKKGPQRLPENLALGEIAVFHGAVLSLVRGSEIRPIPGPSPKTLLVVKSGQTYSLRKITTIIGRRDPKRGIEVDIDLSLLDKRPPIISRRHASITCKGEICLLTDLGSTNGTWLNEEYLIPNQPYLLKDGDEIALGRSGVRLKFLCR
nr:FHA domain-containing protein [Chloroflexota bacterium]